MCDHCGCSGTAEHTHEHDHSHQIDVQESVLSYNDRLAEQNRGFFKAKKITAINMLSAPGSGKTTLLEQTAADQSLPFSVIVGDLQTENDADRLKSKGVTARQIITGEVCHLDAHMIQHAMEHMQLQERQIVFIENVGNLVCPAMFDLGEQYRVVLLSVTEGEDKPLKYPVMFRQADLVVITKADLADAVEFDLEAAEQNIQATAPKAQIITLSAKTGDGLDQWKQWLASLSA